MGETNKIIWLQTPRMPAPKMFARYNTDNYRPMLCTKSPEYITMLLDLLKERSKGPNYISDNTYILGDDKSMVPMTMVLQSSLEENAENYTYLNLEVSLYHMLETDFEKMKTPIKKLMKYVEKLREFSIKVADAASISDDVVYTIKAGATFGEIAETMNKIHSHLITLTDGPTIMHVVSFSAEFISDDMFTCTAIYNILHKLRKYKDIMNSRALNDTCIDKKLYNLCGISKENMRLDMVSNYKLLWKAVKAYGNIMVVFDTINPGYDICPF